MTWSGIGKGGGGGGGLGARVPPPLLAARRFQGAGLVEVMGAESPLGPPNVCSWIPGIKDCSRCRLGGSTDLGRGGGVIPDKWAQTAVGCGVVLSQSCQEH